MKPAREISVLQSLAQHGKGELSYSHVVQLHDYVVHDGPNGSHQCLVFELLGPSVAQTPEELNATEDKLEPETVVKLSRQLLKGINFIQRWLRTWR